LTFHWGGVGNIKRDKPLMMSFHGRTVRVGIDTKGKGVRGEAKTIDHRQTVLPGQAMVDDT